MDVSVILVNYNTKDLTRDCLKSIYEKTQGLNFDIWIVDNDSHDDSCDMIKNEFPQVNLIESKENLGFGRGNNLAIEKSEAKYIFLLNTDTILINNAIKILFDFMESNEKIGACGGNLYDANMKNIHSYGFLDSPKRYLLRLLGLRYFLANSKDRGNNEKEELKEVEQIIGADLMIKKSVLDKVGIFDPRFFLYREESELQFRIKKEGYKIFINPEAKIFHLEGASTKKNKKRRRQFISQSDYLFLKLCYPDISTFWLRVLCSLGQIYRFLFAPTYTFKTLKYIWNN